MRFATPPLVEETELLGPAVLQLYCSSTDEEILVFASLHAVDGDGDERELSRAWLRGSHHQVAEGTPPYAPYHPHDRRQALVPGEVALFEIGFSGVSVRLLPGERLALRVASADEDQPPADPLRATAAGHVARQSASVVTVHHGPAHPSALVLPVTEGNVLGTFLSGGELPGKLGPIPTAKIKRLKVAGQAGES